MSLRLLAFRFLASLRGGASHVFTNLIYGILTLWILLSGHCKVRNTIRTHVSLD